MLLNLASANERLRVSTHELSPLNLDVIRIEAVVGSDLIPDLRLIENAAVAGCWHSHQKAYNFIVDNKLSGALVVEDDILILNHQKIFKYLQDFEQYNLELIQFGFISPHPISKFEYLFQNLEHFLIRIIFNFKWIVPSAITNRIKRFSYWRHLPKDLVPNSFLAGTHCYFISNAGALKLLNKNIPTLVPADGFLRNAVELKFLEGARLTKSLAKQRASVSSITGNYNRER